MCVFDILLNFMEGFYIFDDFEEEVVVIDRNYKIIYANEKYAKDLGYTSKEEVIGKECFRISHYRDEPCDGECHPCPLKEIEKTGKAVNVIHTHYTHDKDEFPVEICAYPLKDGSVLQIIRSIKNDKEKYYLFSLSQRLSSISYLALGVAHQINTPLNIIYTCVQILEKEYGEKEEIERIKEAVCTCKDHINKLLLMVRNSKERSLVDIRKAVEDCLELIKIYAEDKGVIIERDVQECGFVLGSEADLRHVITNLLVNAIDVSDIGKKVYVKTSVNGNCAVIEVQDEGPGIYPEELSKIFLPFYQGKIRKNKDGCGLGLAIVDSILRDMGGCVHVDSQPGRGSTFVIKPPIL
jgi:two-component system NtrC family sensor kinase